MRKLFKKVSRKSKNKDRNPTLIDTWSSTAVPLGPVQAGVHAINKDSNTTAVHAQSSTSPPLDPVPELMITPGQSRNTEYHRIDNEVESPSKVALMFSDAHSFSIHGGQFNNAQNITNNYFEGTPLSKLPYSWQAFHDSDLGLKHNRKPCAEGTRLQILEEIEEQGKAPLPNLYALLWRNRKF
ncbi:hypothetical protein BDP27DRAFT_935644 [Rhodocollybia butyracea]|uniref:Uncharacterized protein n=1 Tax=Rhodocollybia butyracea TaxID=206335 RepID=A0A9P5PPN3_9AGAR|nr:hypothetical protein BDP27DRAFT_935644 [Rhodocollybia butyracea]